MQRELLTTTSALHYKSAILQKWYAKVHVVCDGYTYYHESL